ncbi:MAG: cation transporter, partial [Firmicutes bacterium]|nr:cation transporter [Bacillota bacterium]
MKKKYKLINLGCANCAAKMENDLNKLDGVKAAQISFMTQRLTLDAAEEQLEAILAAAQQICAKY